MNKETIQSAIDEAERFIDAALKAKSELGERYPNHAFTAAAKRASMDLTRALATSAQRQMRSKPTVLQTPCWRSAPRSKG